MNVRFAPTNSQVVIELGELYNLSMSVTKDIFEGRYDGYACKNSQLADHITGNLSLATSHTKWRIYGILDDSGYRRVWVER